MPIFHKAKLLALILPFNSFFSEELSNQNPETINTSITAPLEQVENETPTPSPEQVETDSKYSPYF